MTSAVSFFVPPPASAATLRELHAYGPDGAGGFHPDLAVELDSGAPEGRGALATMDGLVRVVVDPASPGTCALVLRPAPVGQGDLGSIWPRSSVCFVYRNLDVDSVAAACEVAIADAEVAASGIATGSSVERISSFLAGNFPIYVSAGDALGDASSDGAAPGWARLSLEIVFLSSGLGAGEEGWSRVLDLIAPAASTRRADPVAFYWRVKSGAPKLALLDGHEDHRLLTATTRRALLEMRDEYDQPHVGVIRVHPENSAWILHDLTAARRGTVELASVPPEADVPAPTTYVVQVGPHVFTELPSGDEAVATPSLSIAPPFHWALQCIVMDQATEVDNWFSMVGPRGGLPRYTEGNRVTPLIDGIRTYERLFGALNTVKAPEDFVYHAGWFLQFDFPLLPDIEDSTFGQEVEKLSTQRGAAIAVLGNGFLRFDPPELLWPVDQNRTEVEAINALPTGMAIQDSNIPFPGSHHQKLTVIHGQKGAVAFCGGIDLKDNRLQDTRHLGEAPYHDVHSVIEGPAVADLHATFVERWNAHPNRPGPLPAGAPLAVQNAGSHFVQVTRTYGPSHQHPFAPNGDLSTLATTRRALQRSQRFVYIEDQYLHPYSGGLPFSDAKDTLGLMTDLFKALERPSFRFLLMVIPESTGLWADFADHYRQLRCRRRDFIAPLRDAFPEKVFVYSLRRESPPAEIYVHAKTLIVDDVYFRIGSTNFNRRSMTHDSECDVHVIDGALWNGGRRLAKEYRIALWGEHLNMSGPVGAALEDPEAALRFWQEPPLGARVRTYDENDGAQGPDEALWSVIDPDGR
ncbi:MAG: hypothetical protein R3B70_42905 [Polyangiaceae bacterium]